MDIITDNYKDLNKQLHASNPEYGTSGARWREYVRNISNWGRSPILDFGCGKCTLSKSLGPAYKVTNYDPCVEGLDTPPEPHDVVVCSDVMEHVEPELVPNVLAEIRRLTKQKAFFVIGLTPAVKFLADGRNAHISLKSQAEWKDWIGAAGFRVKQESNPNEPQADAWFIFE